MGGDEVNAYVIGRAVAEAVYSVLSRELAAYAPVELHRVESPLVDLFDDLPADGAHTDSRG